MIDPCPYCGSENGVLQNQRAVGWAQATWNSNGHFIELCTDRSWFQSNATYRCQDCYKIRRDVVASGLDVINRPKSKKGGREG